MSTLPIVKRITIDLDVTDINTTVYKLIKNYIYARLKFGKDKVKVYLTSSGRGFRIYIDEDVDVFTNLLERAVMDDDPYRIWYSLKRYAMSGDPNELDVEFYYKKSLKTGRRGHIKEINMEEILGNDLIKKLEQTYGTKIFEDIMKEKREELIEKFKNIIKPQKILYISVPSKYLDEIAKYLADAHARFRVFVDIYKDENVIVRIIASEEFLQEFLKNFRDKIERHKLVEEYSKS